MRAKLIGATAVCIALIAGALTIVFRNWVWFNDPQHSSATQAATAIILGIPTLAFAVFATIAAIRSAEASEAQARAADAQAQSARSQTQVAEVQLEISRAALKEQTRPILQLERLDPGKPWYEWGQRYEIENAGTGAALKLEVAAIRSDRSSPWGTDRTMFEFTIAPQQASPLLIRGGGYTYLRIFYESLTGHRYISTFAFTPQNGMVTVYVENSTGQRPLREDNLDPKAMSEWQIAQRDADLHALQ
jgi:hypothetical protein